MDGTFIPLEGNADNVRDLAVLGQQMNRHQIDLVYVTGRDFALVNDAIDTYQLPAPMWVICDVGAAIYHRGESGDYDLLAEYRSHLSRIVATVGTAALLEPFSEIAGLRKQEESKQSEFKLSFYADAKHLDKTAGLLQNLVSEMKLPYEMIASVDPFTGDGLIDLLPRGVSKASALDWWAKHVGCHRQSIVFSGDSGNDLAALTAGYRSIVVGNASASLIEKVQQKHRSSAWDNRLHVAQASATSGVLEGLEHFLSQPQ
ncbi:Mannosylfructose-phosphate phosphatase [Planctomycetes bacterium K23_9]|uniref:Mannosylfructose-phosphate phosphatase n=2 Tax=Stieleria marina TaxID=1930275 RepID=A0A517NYH6_9BACT|nr:Mannosylfructose-phosphate phosphatase [Planctomycetes bacterium K23_9]